jgi:hypothetical protein
MLETAFWAARYETLYAPQPAVPRFLPMPENSTQLVRQPSLLSAYASPYSRIVNPFVLSVMLFGTQKRGGYDSDDDEAAVRVRARAQSTGARRGGLVGAVLRHVRAAVAGCAPSQCSVRRGVQCAVAVSVASIVVLMPLGRATFPNSALYAPGDFLFLDYI